MRLINTAIPLFLVVLQLAKVGLAAPSDVDDDRIYHCACYVLIQLHELIHPFKRRQTRLGKSFRRVSSSIVPDTQGLFSEV